MKTKNLALASGIVGLVGGIILIFGVYLTFSAAMNDLSYSLSSGSVSTSSSFGVSGFLLLLKIALLALGIMGAYYYKGDARVSSGAYILLIVAGAIGLIPFLGWVSGILAIIGGALYLGALKKFQE